MATANASTSTTPSSGSKSGDFAGAVQGHAAAPGRQHPLVPDAIGRRYCESTTATSFQTARTRLHRRRQSDPVADGEPRSHAQRRGHRTAARLAHDRGAAPRRSARASGARQRSRALKVKGYEPNEAERRQVRCESQAQRRGGDTRSRVEPGTWNCDSNPQGTSVRTGGSAAGEDGAARLRRDGDPDRPQRRPDARRGDLGRRCRGTYRFDPEQRMSFYVMGCAPGRRPHGVGNRPGARAR